jgi:type I restriction enzyme M protein
VANEWEFQGDVLKWMTRDIKMRVGLRIGDVGQEKQFADQKRSDLIIWTTRDVDALASVELKTLATGITDLALQNDVIKKARRVGAPYCVLWNQRNTVIHATPVKPPHGGEAPEMFTADPLTQFDELKIVTSKDYVGHASMEAALAGRARDILTALVELRDTGTVRGRIVEPSVFVDWLAHEVRSLRKAVTSGLRREAAKNRTLRSTLQAWASAQGMSAPRAEVLFERASAQLAYRVVGQAVFYLAYSRHMKGLPSFEFDAGEPLRPQLQSHWTSIRAIDYEALYAEDAVLDRLPLSPAAEAGFLDFLDRLNDFNWAGLDASVLGAVFENLIPVSERDLLGQYYTSGELADLIIAFCVDGSTRTVLDPACGTGEFLVRAYDRLLKTRAATSHSEALDAIWGVDISHFPTELAVINLCRQDFNTPNNFPRVVTSDFFDFDVGDVHYLPPARVGVGQAKVPIAVPSFDAVVGNPPYLRWQKLDDLDPSYRRRVQKVALNARVGAKELLDIYVLFFIHALDLLKPGGRVGFVTSNAWLATDYGVALQLFLLRQSRIVAIIGSEAEPFFPQAAINTVVTVVEKPVEPLASDDDYALKFVSLKKTIAEYSDAHAGDRWAAMDELAAIVESATKPVDAEGMRIRLGSRVTELDKLNERLQVLPWHVPMRAPRLLLEAMPTDYEFS